MGKRRKGQKPAEVVYDSDDERAYSKEDIPDPQSAEFYEDEIDEFHSNREKILLDKGVSLEPAGSSSEEEVLGFDDDTDSEEENEEVAVMEERLRRLKSQGVKEDLASDIEDEVDDLPDSKAWGLDKSKFYNDDMGDYDEVGDSDGSGTEAAFLEEKEALAIQKRLAEQFDEEDFGVFEVVKKSEESKTEDISKTVKKDLSKLSKREKLELLRKESPELLELIEDNKLKMTELQERLLPIFRKIQSGKIPDSKGVQYIQTKVQLYLNYCVNIHFYMILKAKHVSVEHHPVIARLLQFRKIIKELEPVDQLLKDEVDQLLTKIKNGEEIIAESPVLSEKPASKAIYLKRRKIIKAKETKDKKKLSELIEDEGDEEIPPDEAKGGRTWGRKRKVEFDLETRGEKEALAYYDMMKAGKKTKINETEEEPAGGDIEQSVQGNGVDENREGNGDGEEGGKRGITYQISKNKGLTPKRKREQRNPRVKHRLKYRKAKIRRKGMIREARTELQKYSGEISGIRAGIKRSVKLK